MVQGTSVAVGEKAPPFELESSTGAKVSLRDFEGKHSVVLHFYPRADTPGCTTEACGFRDALPQYDEARVAVLGVSPDEPAAVTKFAQKYKLNFPLLADADHAVAERYGVWREKSMYGRKYWGAARVTFVIGRDGRVRHVFESVKPKGHEQEVMTWLREHPE